MKRIMIIEDDKLMRDELAKLLQSHEYETYICEDFDTAHIQAKEVNPHLILLDINLIGVNGFTICKRIRRLLKTPIIFVTSRNTDEDELNSIISGGDDFIVKPYNKLILLEKIKRLITTFDPTRFKEIKIDEVILDLHLSLIKYQDQEVELSRNEFKIMYYLFLNPHKDISKDELIEYLWNDKFYVDENILNVNMTRIRKKLESIGLFDFIKTIHKKGYRI